MPKSNKQKIYEFEDFRLDAAHLLLYRRGQEISLTPKVVETLLKLIENGGKIISKDELMEKVWANAIVEEGNLSQNLFRLRKVLGETKDGKPFIETLRQRVRWSLDSNSIIAVADPVDGYNLWQTNLSSGERHPITNFTAEKIYRFDVSPDRRFYALTRGNYFYDAVLIEH